jgi:hypothetical protein
VDILRLNWQSKDAFFASEGRLFHSIAPLYLKLRLRKFVLGFGEKLQFYCSMVEKSTKMALIANEQLINLF